MKKELSMMRGLNRPTCGEIELMCGNIKQLQTKKRGVEKAKMETEE